MSAILAACFTASGAAALGLELLWMRSAALVLGGSAGTTAAVLACYFTGLALGAAAGRAPAARPVRRYARLELGAAAGAAWSFAVFRALSTTPAIRMLAAAGPAGGVVAVAGAVLPATVCLGATLPTLGSAVVPRGAVGRRGGFLYGVNTLGGALGIAAMGFWLPAAIGVPASYAAVAATSALAGLVALAVRERPGAAPTPPSTASAPGSPAPGSRAPARLAWIAAGTGALGLGVEVLWTRLFAQVLHNSVYSFAAVSLVFLVALTLGAWLAALLLRDVAPATVAAAACLAAGAGTVAGVWLFVRRTDGLAYVGMRTGLGEYVARTTALAAATAGPGCVGAGAVLPALWATFGDAEGAAQPMGGLGAANAVGAVAGALLAAHAILPLLGLRGGFLLAAIGWVVLAEAVAPEAKRLRGVAWAALVAIALLDPLRAPLAHLAPGETLRRVAESASGVVTVVDTGADRQLRADNYYVLGGTAAARNERRQGLVPLLLHPAPHRVLFVGLASGISASAAPALGVERTTVVELLPDVVDAARAEFAPWNADLVGRADVRVLVDDGRRFIAAGDEGFDVVVSDLFIPWHAGAGSLYAREMYAAVRHRLAPGGLFCQWLPLYQLTREEFDLIARTMLATFPHVTLWRDDFYPDRPVVALVGELEPRARDASVLARRLAAIPDWARDPLLASPDGLAMLFVGTLTDAGVIPPGPLNADDRPLLEFLAPRLTRVGAAGDKDWFTGDAFADFSDQLAEREPADAPARAGRALYRYALAEAHRDAAGAGRWEAEVRRLVPDVVASAERDEPVATLADARRTLDDLRTEQERLRTTIEAVEHRLGEIRGPE